MKKIAYILPAFCLSVFGWLGLQDYRAAFDAYRSQSWPTTVGTVAVSDWRSYGGNKGCHYELHFRYTYVVDGVPHDGRNYRFGGECDDAVRLITAAHPIGESVLVHYDPVKPERSVVAAGDVSENTKAGLVVSPAMVLISLFSFWYIRRGGFKSRWKPATLGRS